MEIYIHIGLPKCASTFLQEKLFEINRNQEVLYNPQELTTLINKIDIRKRGNYTLDEIEQKIQEIILNLKCKKLIVSDEGLSGGGFNLDYKNNIKTLKKLFPKAKIILILRYQTDFIISLYNQMVEQGRCRHNIEFFLNRNNINSDNILNMLSYKFAININEYNYVDLVKTLNNYFGKNFKLFFFENFKENNKLFIKKLSTAMNLENMPKNFRYVNKSLSSKSIKLLIIIHKISLLFGYEIPYQKNNQYNYLNRDDLNSIDNFLCWKNLVHLLRKHLEPRIRDKTDKKVLDLKNELDKMYKNKNKKLKEILKDKLPDIYI